MAIEEAPSSELSNKILTYLASHPNGTKLVELEEELGVTRIQLDDITRTLINAKKVGKRDLLYFTILEFSRC